MKNNELLSKVSKTFGKAKLKIKEHSPEILLFTGIVSAIGGTILACKATLKVPEIMDETKNELDIIHSTKEKCEPDEYKKVLVATYGKTAVKFIKVYSPAFVIGAFSLTSILASNDILRKRNAALVAAYSIVDLSFKDYRNRVVERFGEKVDQELRYSIKEKTIETIEVNEDGEAITKNKTVEVSEYLDDGYSKWFDECNDYFDNDPEYNRMFLQKQQRRANDILNSRGYIFLNEVYDMLGIPKTRAGQIVGWIYDENNKSGDNYIDFGILDTYRESVRDFVNGYEPSILLRFNVDGPIIDRVNYEINDYE